MAARQKTITNEVSKCYHRESSHGANAAWWGIMVLAFDLNSLMKRLVPPEGWAPKRLKAIRFGLINLAGRVVSRAQ